MRTARTALAISVLVLLGACGSQDDTVTTVPADTPSPSPPSDQASGTELTIGVSTTGGETDTTWRLTCDPAGGDHPDPDAACAAVEAAGGAAAFAPPPKDQMCTEIYGGPQTASVSGVVAGEEVSATFSRTDGCEIARWDALADLLGSSGPA